MIINFCFISATTAFFDTVNDHYRSPSAARPPQPQFQSWYPKHSRELIEITQTTCNASYADYINEYYAPRGSSEATYLLTTCYNVESCILSTIPSGWQANYNSANTILGLMPTLLASIGPSFAEISLLSAHRPLLSFLISVGASAIWPNRIFEYVHPPEILRRRSRSVWAGKMRPWPAALMSLVQYTVAIGAIVNGMMTSIEVGRKSILAFACTTTYAPLVWSSIPSVIHLLSVLSYFIARKVAQRRISKERLSEEAANSKTSVENNIESAPNHTAQATSPFQTPPPSKQQQVFHKIWRSCRHALTNEFTVCANHSKSNVVQVQDKTVPRISVLLAITAGLMNFFHVTLGIIIFSSLQLIAVEDVFKRVLCRYIVSSTACRLLLIIEMAGLKSSIDAESGGDSRGGGGGGGDGGGGGGSGDVEDFLSSYNSPANIPAA